MPNSGRGGRPALTVPWSWGATAAEVDADYPGDGLISGPVLRLHRAIEIQASASTVYLWVCQLTIALYSYDLIGNRGRSGHYAQAASDDQAAGRADASVQLP